MDKDKDKTRAKTRAKVKTKADLHKEQVRRFCWSSLPQKVHWFAVRALRFLLCGVRLLVMLRKVSAVRWKSGKCQCIAPAMIDSAIAPSDGGGVGVCNATEMIAIKVKLH